MEIDELIEKLEKELEENGLSENFWCLWKKVVKMRFHERLEILKTTSDEIIVKEKKIPNKIMLSSGEIPEVIPIKFYKIDLTLPFPGELPLGKIYEWFLVGIDETNRKIIDIKYYYEDRFSYHTYNFIGEDFQNIAPLLELIIRKNRKTIF